MGKKVNTAFIYLFSVLIVSCADDKEVPNVKASGGSSLEFVMTRFSENVINNTQVYLFDGEGTAAGQFRQKIPGVTYGADRVTMSVAAGTWDFMLLSADRDISGGVIFPVRGHARTDLKMWETHSSGGVLPSIPELRTAYLAHQPVVANQENTPTTDAALIRNAALVKVVITEAGGLDARGTHTLKLTDVPTTLNWVGGLYPDKNNPAVSLEPMTGAFTIHANPDKPGRQLSDELSFIIPAHKGTDYLTPSPRDTTTSHLRLSVDLALEGGTRFKKENVVVPNVPRVNGTLVVNLTFGGKLDVSTEVLPWVDKEVDVDLSQTLLYTDKASVGLAFKDTLQVNTNATDFTVEKNPGATWLTVTKLENNAVEITADVNTYVDNHPRTSSITVKAGNVAKTIPVTQRPDEGTIKVNLPKDQILAPLLGYTQSEKGLVTSIGGNWKFLEQSAPKVTASVTEGSPGTTEVQLIRTSTSIPDESFFERYYGDGLAVFKNMTTLATDTVRVSNLFIGLSDKAIEMAQPISHPDTTFTIDNVKVYGGEKHSLNIISKPDWVHGAPDSKYDPATGKFTFVCDREPNEEPRTGNIVLGHSDLPNYQVTLPLVQDIIVRIPEFDYFVVKFNWVLQAGSDLDVKVGFTGNPTSVVAGNITYNTNSVAQINDKYVGYRAPAGFSPDPSIFDDVSYNAQRLLQWGGDVQGGQGETVYFNAPIINFAPYPGQYGIAPNAANILPRTLTLRVAAHWATKPASPSDLITCTIYSYLGGTMTHVGTNFNNTGGKLVYSSSSTFRISRKETGANIPYDTFCDIIYDRKKHTAKIDWKGTMSVEHIQLGPLHGWQSIPLRIL